MNKENITAFLRHPKRRLIVFTGTFAIILLIVWPLADDYYDVIEARDSLRNQIAMSELSISTTSVLVAKLTNIDNKLFALESQTVANKNVGEFRKQIVDTVRQVNCRVNKLQVKTPTTRRWHQLDHPINAVSSKERGKATNYDITSTLISLTVTGRLENLKKLLATVQEKDKFIHTQRFSIRSVGQNRNESILEIDLRLFGFKSSNSDKI